MSDFDELLQSAYQTALFGDGVFGGMADVEKDQDRREKLRLLQIIVARDHRALAPLVEARGGKTRPQGSAIATSMGANAAAGGQTWEEFIQGLHDLHPSILDTFTRCRLVAPEPDHPALAMSVRDTQVIIAFTELELAGLTESSRAMLDWLLEGDA